jgi:hypothetical protein
MKGLGKWYSISAKVLAVLFVIVAWALNGRNSWGYTGWDLIQIGIFIMGTGFPIDFSKWLEKLKSGGG